MKASEVLDTFTTYKIYWFHCSDFKMKDSTYHLLDIILDITPKVNTFWSVLIFGLDLFTTEAIRCKNIS